MNSSGDALVSLYHPVFAFVRGGSSHDHLFPSDKKVMTLSLEMQDDVLAATLSGELSMTQVALLGKQILSCAAEKGARKILVNCLNLRGRLSTMDRYSLAIAGVNFARSLRINPRLALVGLPPTFDGFALRVAINRGAKGALFADLHEALEWLKHTG